MIQIECVMKRLGVGVTELAKRLNVNRMTVYYYIKQGEKNSVDTLIKIASALNVSVIDLFEQPKSDTITCPYCGGKIKIGKE